MRSPNGPFRRPLVTRGETNRAGPARSARSPPADSSRRADLLPPEGVSSSRQKTKDKRRETPPSSTLCPALKISHPTPNPTHRPENRKCRHFRPKTLPERDFYPSIFRVFCTLFDAILKYLCPCTRLHKIRAFSRCPPIFAAARHQSAPQTAPKAGPKLRAFSRVSPISASARCLSVPQTAPKPAPNLRAFFAQPYVDVQSVQSLLPPHPPLQPSPPEGRSTSPGGGV